MHADRAKLQPTLNRSMLLHCNGKLLTQAGTTLAYQCKKLDELFT